MSASDLVKHVVIIVKENHTFDNYFGRFPGVNGAQFPQAGDPTPDPPHDHRAWLKRNGPTGAVRLQYTERDIPLYSTRSAISLSTGLMRGSTLCAITILRTLPASRNLTT